MSKAAITCIIPAYNESRTIRKVVEAVSRSKVDEIIVVDDGSTDETSDRTRNAGVKIIRHRTNLGKGAAMRTGLANAHGRIILFIDADLENLTPKKINMLVEPIINGRADFVKGYFSHYRPKIKIAELLYKPLLKYLFNVDTGFIQPVSGQIAGKKNFFDKIEFRNDYGVDISIAIDVVKHKLRSEEVCIGRLEHRTRPLYEIEKISDTIIRTMLERAGFKLKK